jgi:hypothetical protein
MDRSVLSVGALNGVVRSAGKMPPSAASAGFPSVRATPAARSPAAWSATRDRRASPRTQREVRLDRRVAGGLAGAHRPRSTIHHAAAGIAPAAMVATTHPGSGRADRSHGSRGVDRRALSAPARAPAAGSLSMGGAMCPRTAVTNAASSSARGSSATGAVRAGSPACNRADHQAEPLDLFLARVKPT